MRAEALVLGGYQENKGKDMTSDKKARGMRIAKVIYCTVTLLFVLPLMMTGVTFLMGFRPNIDNVVTHLGYPVYVMKILGGQDSWRHRHPMGSVPDA